VASQKIQGIFTPHLVPLDKSGEINEPELRGISIGSSHRAPTASIPTARPANSRGSPAGAAADRADRLRAGSGASAGAGQAAAEANVRETLDACAAYAEFGARAVAIVSPYYYQLSPESVYAYFREIAIHSPIDVTLYNIPMFASPIDVPTIRRLVEFPRIVGIKDSSGDLAFMMRMIAAVRPVRPDFCFLTGWEAVLVPALMVGADGGTHATAGVVPEITRKMFDLTRAGQLDEAMRLQFRLLELFDAMLYSADFPDGFRAAVELARLRFGA